MCTRLGVLQLAAAVVAELDKAAINLQQHIETNDGLCIGGKKDARSELAHHFSTLSGGLVNMAMSFPATPEAEAFQKEWDDHLRATQPPLSPEIGLTEALAEALGVPASAIVVHSLKRREEFPDESKPLSN